MQRQSPSRRYPTLQAHATCAKAVVSTSKMLSVICLVQMHLSAGCTHLMVYQCRPKHIAVVILLQSQSRNASGRNASGDLTIRPLSSTSEKVYTPARAKQELRTQSSRTPVDAIWNPIGSWSGFLLCGHHFHQIHVCHFPTVSRRKPSERIRRWSRGHGAVRPRHAPQKSSQKVRGLMPESSSSSRGWPSFIGNCTEKDISFLERQARRLSLQFAKALSFSVSVHGRLCISTSRSAILSRVRLAIVWLNP